MIKYLLTAGLWASLSYPIYTKLGGVAVCIYGFLSIAGLLVWAVTRKK